MAVQPIPEGFHTITPHLTLRNCASMIDFYRRAFGAQELQRHPVEGTDQILYALLRIGDSLFMVNDEFPEQGACALEKGASGVTVNLYVPDVDALFQQAVKAGAEVVMPPTDMFWGDRYSLLHDPSGHRWAIMTHKEDVTPAEMAARARQECQAQGEQS